MEKTFNELFDDFFNKKPKRRTKSKKQEPEKPRDGMERIMDMLTNLDEYSGVDNIDEIIEKEIDRTLGKPDKTEFYSEGGLYYEKRTWHTPTGDMVKLIVNDDPSINVPPPTPKSLQEKLDEAVAEENYEKAAAIRDEMVKQNNKNKKIK